MHQKPAVESVLPDSRSFLVKHKDYISKQEV